MNWLVRGAAEWQRVGLAPPPSVLEATEQYRRDMDRVGLFVAERCRIDHPGHRTKTAVVYAAYVEWCETTNVRPFARAKFREKLVNEHGFKVVARDGYEFYDEVLLTSEDDL